MKFKSAYSAPWYVCERRMAHFACVYITAFLTKKWYLIDTHCHGYKT